MRRRVAAVCLAFSAVVAVLPFAMDGEHITLNAELRERLTGEGHRFATIELGTIHYELAGPESGALVVLVHGVSGPTEAFDGIVKRGPRGSSPAAPPDRPLMPFSRNGQISSDDAQGRGAAPAKLTRRGWRQRRTKG
jgi:hypothetical protein